MKKLYDKLTKIRAEIEALSAERDTIETAPIPRSEAETRIAAVINAPFPDTLIGSGPNARFDADPGPPGLITGTFNATDLLQTLARPGALRALIPDVLQAYLIGRYDQELAGLKPGLPLVERRARLAELGAEIFQLEVDEESLIESLEADGANVLRRGNADPAAQLGLDVRDSAA